MLTDTNQTISCKVKLSTVASCSDLQTGHLRLAAYNLAFFSLLGFVLRPHFPRGKFALSTKPHCQRSGNTETKKSIGLPNLSISAFFGKVAINWRVSHVPGASPRRGKQYKNSKKRQWFFITFFEFFCEKSPNPWKSKAFSVKFFRDFSQTIGIHHHLSISFLLKNHESARNATQF